MNSNNKLAIYIDGSNFYFSVKNTFDCKIDIEKFCKKLSKNSKLIKINYYTAPVQRLNNPEMYAEQQKFFEKLKKIKDLKIIFGRLEKHKKDGKFIYTEKATDVNLALDLVLDAIDNVYDTALLISNDGDFSGVVSSVISRFNKKVNYVAIGNKKSISYHLKKVASSTFVLDKTFIEDLMI